MMYILISQENKDFEKYCNICRDNVVIENLVSNGGTLQVPNAVFYSNVLIIAHQDVLLPNQIVGFIALNTRSESEIYINQIAVKNDHKKQGIGRGLVYELINYADNRDITCHVRVYNVASQALFKSCNFEKVEKMSNDSNYFFVHRSKKMINEGTYVKKLNSTKILLKGGMD